MCESDTSWSEIRTSLMPGQQDSTNQYAKQNLQQIYKNVIYFAITNWLGIQIEGWHKDKSNFCMVFSNSSDNFIQLSIRQHAKHIIKISQFKTLHGFIQLSLHNYSLASTNLAE
jgi:hypothetical protein